MISTSAVVLVLLVADPSPAYTAKVVGIADGDTITVLRDREPVKVRLHGIDCPEGRQGFGDRARELTGNLAFGKVVTVRPVDVDRYGRTVAEVILPDGAASIASWSGPGWRGGTGSTPPAD